jgi:hypothetical protein
MLTPQELEDNVQYVLGMTEHYKKDEELYQMLRLKGLEEDDVQQILRTVAYSFNLKRMHQQKKAIILNSILLGFFHVIPAITLGLNAIGISIGALKLYLLFIWSFRLSWALLVLVPIWLVYSIFAYFKYKKRTEEEGGISEIGAI